MSEKYPRATRKSGLFLLIPLVAASIPAVAGKPQPPSPPPSPPPGITTLISVATDGNPGNSGSASPSMSADTRYVAFASSATNLIPGGTNDVSQMFVRDRVSGVTELITVALDGTSGNGNSWSVTGGAISADARYVVFYSYATNLVSGPQNFYSHVYLHDRATHTTERVSVASDGTPADSYSYSPTISADGRYVVFESYATNLVPGDTNGQSDVFVHDRLTGTTERVSVATDGAQGNKSSRRGDISSDGRYVAFISDATNLVPNDTNAALDVFVRDRLTGTTERVSVANDGSQANDWSGVPRISADGRFVAFSSEASNLVAGDTNAFMDVFIRDRVSGTTQRVSVTSGGQQGDDASFLGDISADGNFVGFVSYATNLVAGDTNWFGDSFIRDRSAATTERVSLATDGTQGDSDSGYAVPSNDGYWVLFDSFASNFAPGDTNGQSDVFMRERTGTTP